MKKFVSFAFLIAMMGSTPFNEGARADECPPGCTVLKINYEHGTLDQDTVDANYQGCGGGWKSHGVWGSGMGPYTYCVEPGAAEIIIRKLSYLPSVLLTIPKEQTKKPRIILWCKGYNKPIIIQDREVQERNIRCIIE